MRGDGEKESERERCPINWYQLLATIHAPTPAAAAAADDDDSTVSSEMLVLLLQNPFFPIVRAQANAVHPIGVSWRSKDRRPSVSYLLSPGPRQKSSVVPRTY